MDSNFSAAEFLANLQNRFQTLEDLQSELQELLKSLNKELVDLVNDNYTDFLSLGDRLRGGEERIEEIRVGLLGFQRDVTGVRDLIAQRSDDVKELLQVKISIRQQIRTGTTLLEIDQRVTALESQLGMIPEAKTFDKPKNTNGDEDFDEPDLLSNGFNDWDEVWTKDDFGGIDSDVSDEDPDVGASGLPHRLARNVEALQIIQLLNQRCGEAHPFILAQRDRLSAIKDILRRDLEAEIRAQSTLQVKQRLIKLRTELDD